MRKKDKEKTLEFYAINYDWNKKSLYKMNVIRKDIIEKIIKKIETKSRKNRITNYEEFKSELISEFKYHYLAKREYEVAMGDLPCGNIRNYVDSLEKISVYDQIEPNLEVICQYVYNEMNLKNYLERENE